jgi:hypothetical protein
MRGALAAILRSLVLPAGATSGQRIVLDGVNGTIGVYDSANRLRLQIKTSTPELAVYDAAGALLASVSDTPDDWAGVLGVELPTGSPTSLAFTVRNQGDTGYRFAVRQDGTLLFDDGDQSGPTGVRLTRSTGPERLVSSGGLAAAGDITWGGAGYTQVVPTWTSTGAAPSVGNSTFLGWYKELGRHVHYYGYLEKGSTATNGTGSLAISLPTLAATSQSLERFPAGSVWLRDSSPAADYFGIPIIDTVNQDRFYVRGLGGTGTSALWAGTAPITFVAGPPADWIGWNVLYEKF